MVNVTLLCCTAQDLLEQVPPESAALVYANPPWPQGNRRREADEPKPLRLKDIAGDLEEAFEAAADDAYLALWAKYPVLFEFLPLGIDPWVGCSGGSWVKKGRRAGGYHTTGDAEPLLLYRKGSPKPDRPIPNGWAPAWEEPRMSGRQKPMVALFDLLELTRPGDLVLDLYAGNAAMAQACARKGRHYIGCEPSGFTDYVRLTLELEQCRENASFEIQPTLDWVHGKKAD